jgi:hypothetical protein
MKIVLTVCLVILYYFFAQGYAAINKDRKGENTFAAVTLALLGVLVFLGQFFIMSLGIYSIL